MIFGADLVLCGLVGSLDAIWTFSGYMILWRLFWHLDVMCFFGRYLILWVAIWLFVCFLALLCVVLVSCVIPFCVLDFCGDYLALSWLCDFDGHLVFGGCLATWWFCGSFGCCFALCKAFGSLKIAWFFSGCLFLCWLVGSLDAIWHFGCYLIRVGGCFFCSYLGACVLFCCFAVICNVRAHLGFASCTILLGLFDSFGGYWILWVLFGSLNVMLLYLGYLILLVVFYFVGSV